MERLWKVFPTFHRLKLTPQMETVSPKSLPIFSDQGIGKQFDKMKVRAATQMIKCDFPLALIAMSQLPSSVNKSFFCKVWVELGVQQQKTLLAIWKKKFLRFLSTPKKTWKRFVLFPMHIDPLREH